ncbi:MAG TPA: hypothetical protein VLH17_06625 [Candidatus Binatia bacterium]|nr:hypothetical protein [Candidatus Binatia bacterium]
MELDPTRLLKSWLKKRWYEVTFLLSVAIYILHSLGMSGEVMAAWAQAILSATAIYASAWITFTAMRQERITEDERGERTVTQETLTQLEIISVARKRISAVFTVFIEQAKKQDTDFHWSAFSEVIKQRFELNAQSADRIDWTRLHPVARQFSHDLADYANTIRVALNNMAPTNDSAPQPTAERIELWAATVGGYEFANRLDAATSDLRASLEIKSTP